MYEKQVYDSVFVDEFTKSRAVHASVVYLPTCQRVPIFKLFFKRIMFFWIPNKFVQYILYILHILNKYIPNVYFLYEYIFLT